MSDGNHCYNQNVESCSEKPSTTGALQGRNQEVDSRAGHAEEEYRKDYHGSTAQSIIQVFESKDCSDKDCKYKKEELIKIIIVDFHDSNDDDTTLFDQLVAKMRNRKFGFSNNFDHVNTLINLEGLVKTTHTTPYNWPYGVAISSKCKCILISDQYSNTINIFDLESKKLKTKFKTLFDPGCLCVENDKLGREDDSLIVSSCKAQAVFKWNNLGSIVAKSMNMERMPPCVWKQDNFGTPRGMIVRYDRTIQNTLFVCDNAKHNITLLNSETGHILRTISKWDGIYLGEPFGIDLNNYGDLVISEKCFNRVQILSLDLGSGEWISKVKFGSKDGSLKCPSGLLFDKINEQILVCDQENQRIAAFKENGELIRTFGCFGTSKSENNNPHFLNYPTTICLYEKTGELFVVDSWNLRVLIFK